LETEVLEAEDKLARLTAERTVLDTVVTGITQHTQRANEILAARQRAERKDTLLLQLGNTRKLQVHMTGLRPFFEQIQARVGRLQRLTHGQATLQSADARKQALALATTAATAQRDTLRDLYTRVQRVSSLLTRRTQLQQLASGIANAQAEVAAKKTKATLLLQLQQRLDNFHKMATQLARLTALRETRGRITTDVETAQKARTDLQAYLVFLRHHIPQCPTCGQDMPHEHAA
jgi:hypothetical protein